MTTTRATCGAGRSAHSSRRRRNPIHTIEHNPGELLMNAHVKVAAINPKQAVRQLAEADLAAADHIMRLDFRTFLGTPDPGAFLGDAGYVRTRWRADPAAAFGAEAGGKLVGSNFATDWGS